VEHIYGCGYASAISLLFLLMWVGTNLYHSNQVQLKFDQWCEVFWRWCWVLGLCNPRSIACEVWSFRFQDKLLTDEVTICMKLYPDVYIVMHSVLFLKTGCDRFKHETPGVTGSNTRPRKTAKDSLPLCHLLFCVKYGHIYFNVLDIVGSQTVNWMY
jgi:hypothetical protein